MIKINKKYLYLGSAILMIIWIAFLSSQTKINKSVNTSTIPLISPNKQTNKEDVLFDPNKVTSAKNVTPTKSGNYYLENGSLFLNDIRGNKKNLTNLNEKIIDFKINNQSIILTTGNLYGNEKKYFLYLINKNETLPISTQKQSPVISISSNSEGNQIAILGNHNIQKDTSNLYLLNPTNGDSSLINSNLERNQVDFINDNQLLLGQYKDKSEPNFKFDIYNIKDSVYLYKDISSAKNKICSNSSFIFSYSFTKKLLNKMSILNRDILELSNSELNQDDKILCTENNIFTINSQNNQLKISTQRLDYTTTESKNIKSNSDELFIQAFTVDGRLKLKYLKNNELFFKDF